MANIASYNVTLTSKDGLDRFNKRTFTVKPGARAFLPKDDQDNIMGFGIGRASKALGNNKYYQADEHNAWIDSPTISRRHAVLSVERNPPHLTIVNVAATHGLFVNGKRVDEKQSALLKNGDEIRLSGDVRRGFELIPPRTFTIHAQPINNTPPSSPDEIPQNKAFSVPYDSDEESMIGLDDTGSSISDEQEISQNDPSETGFVEDSMAHQPFSDVEGSEDEGFDSGLPYGHEGHDYDMSEDDDFDDDLDQRSHIHEGTPDHSAFMSKNQDSMPEATSSARELEELQSPQSEKPSAHRLADLAAVSAMVERSSSPLSSEMFETMGEDQIDRGIQPLETGLDAEENNGGSPEVEKFTSSATFVQQSSGQQSSSQGLHYSFPSKNPSNLVSDDANPTSSKAEPAPYMRNREAESMQRFMMHMASVGAQYDACAPQSQTSVQPRYEESVDVDFSRTLDNPFNTTIAPSMSLGRILDSSAKDKQSLAFSDPPSSFSGNSSERVSWNTPFASTPLQNAPATSVNSDSRFNPWAMYDHPVNEYHEGPFASVKIESMLNNEPPRGDGPQVTESPQAPLPAKMDTEVNGVAKKSGISILDIVENTPTDAPRSLKRKISDMVSFSDATEDTTSSDAAAHVSSSTLPVESNTDKETEPAMEPKEPVKADDLDISPRPQKKAKLIKTPAKKLQRRSTLRVVKTTLTAAATGAVVGGLAVFSALAFLPEAVFQ